MAWAPPVGEKSFVIGQADCFPKMAKNPHTVGAVWDESLGWVTEPPARVLGPDR